MGKGLITWKELGLATIQKPALGSAHGLNIEAPISQEAPGRKEMFGFLTGGRFREAGRFSPDIGGREQKFEGNSRRLLDFWGARTVAGPTARDDQLGDALAHRRTALCTCPRCRIRFTASGIISTGPIGTAPGFRGYCAEEGGNLRGKRSLAGCGGKDSELLVNINNHNLAFGYGLYNSTLFASV